MKLTLTITIEVPDNATVNTTGDGVDVSIEKVCSEFNMPPLIQQCPPPKEIETPSPELVHAIVHPDEPLVRIRPGVKPLPGKLCAICGNRFQPKSSEKTCSSECRKAHHKEMQKVYSKRYEAKKKAQQQGPKPEPEQHHERKTLVLKSGERLCAYCKEPFKIQKFEQHYCSDSCEALHGKKEKHGQTF